MAHTAPPTSVPDPARNGARWHVQLLGGLRLDGAGQQITRLPSRAVAALLARLALWPGRTHAREELVELLWPGVGLAVGRNRLRQALSTLKSLLETPGAAQPVVLADRLGLRVVPGTLQCDARDFEAHLQAGRHADAAACYRGELLPGFYDDWIGAERLRLAALFDGIAPTAAQPPRVPPMPASPQPAAASAPPPAALVALPHYLTRMFGAERQGTRLRTLLQAERLVTLIGPGGAGKTRLAVEVAHALREAVPAAPFEAIKAFDIIAFVPLAACATAAQMLDAMAGTLQIVQGADTPAQALVSALGGRHALLVLDNFEQLVDGATACVAQLLGALPGLHLVVTSRRTLGLAGENEFPVEPLQLPDGAAAADLAGMAANPAVALFVERARAARADFHLGARNAATVAALVCALEGMPLAIELAASRVRSIAPADMLLRLRGPGTPRLDLLARGSRSPARGSAELRHASMQRAIAWSWDQLAPAPARLLSALTVFAGSFTASAAAALADDGDDAALLLDDLVANSLVHVQGRQPEAPGLAAMPGVPGMPDADAMRFGVYQPIREFAAARQDAASARSSRGRLRRWALHWARTLPRTPPLAALRDELPNLLAALAGAVGEDVNEDATDNAADNAADDAIVLLLALRRCLEDVELPAEGLLHAQAAVARCSSPALQAQGHTLLGPMLFTAGQRDAALAHAGQGLQDAGHDPAQRARALHALARVRWRSRRRADEVEPLLDTAQALVAPLDEPELQARLHALRAFVANVHHHDHGRAEQLHTAALALWEGLGNQHAVHSGRYNLAVCAQNAGQHAVCLQRLAPVIASARDLQDWRRLSQSLNVRGNARSGLRDWAGAIADYRECIATAWRSMASYDLAFGLWNLPRALAHRHRPEAALRLCAFAAIFWRTRFGELTAADQRDLLRVRRLAQRQIGAARLQACWHEGEALELAQAVALALGPKLDPKLDPAR